MSEAAGLTGSAGSCLSRLFESYVPPKHQQLRFALGAQLTVSVYWPDRSDCRGSPLDQQGCKVIEPQVEPFGGWGYELVGPASITSAIVMNMTAQTSVDMGGFKVRVKGQEFRPFFQLTTTDEYSSIRFQQTLCGVSNDCIVPGFLGQVPLNAGDAIAVAATLRTDSGEHICGTVPTSYTVDPPSLLTVYPLNLANYSNMPYLLIAGDTAGTATLRVRTLYGKIVEGTFRVIVQ
jgi:hypothetical protein